MKMRGRALADCEGANRPSANCPLLFLAFAPHFHQYRTNPSGKKWYNILYMTKLLSIIIPSYNMERHLRKCLCSVCIEDGRLLDLLDILVVNDGSTDETSAIAHEFANRHPSVFRVIDKANGHYGSCVNRGLVEACGTFVRILDADDYLDTNGLKSLLTFLQNI